MKATRKDRQREALSFFSLHEAIQDSFGRYTLPLENSPLRCPADAMDKGVVEYRLRRK
jgi:hypothetical protein